MTAGLHFEPLLCTHGERFGTNDFAWPYSDYHLVGLLTVMFGRLHGAFVQNVL